ncbi:hypothetical protein [Burkholderia gladioli]|uniref:hypothetical protein n=1 Tax=Burkholderia gladioli TaxID=28095 RepID=UPI003D251684
MENMQNNYPISLSSSAILALERLAEIRYGRNTPPLGWSVTHELLDAGFISHSGSSRHHPTITPIGRAFLKSKK